MAEIINIGYLLLVAAAAAALIIPQSTEPAEHEVDWIIPSKSNAASFYSNFTANTTFALNDTLVFKFKTGAHNVVTLSKKNFENCTVSEKMESFETGPAKIKLNRTGEFYFACAFPFHCTLGQKLSINVANASSSTSSVAPPPSGSPAPPVSFSATLYVLLMAIALI